MIDHDEYLRCLEETQVRVDRMCRGGNLSSWDTYLSRSFFHLSAELLERGPELRWPDHGCVMFLDPYWERVGVTECAGEIPWR